MKRDIFGHKERYEKWKADVVEEGIIGLTKKNSDIILQHVFDMEIGVNISNKNKKGARSYPRLNNIKQRLSQMTIMLQGRGKELNLNEEEVAFYDALEVNDSAVKILGDDALRKIALELTEMIRKSVTIDWTQRESVQADIRVKVRKILRKYGYPPDKQKKATETVLKQAEQIARSWAEKD